MHCHCKQRIQVSQAQLSIVAQCKVELIHQHLKPIYMCMNVMVLKRQSEAVLVRLTATQKYEPAVCKGSSCVNKMSQVTPLPG